jgi:glucans biosynthesis protein
MPMRLPRRALLKAAAASAAIGRGSAAASAPDRPALGDPIAFSYEALKAEARRKVSQPYVEAPRPAPEIVQAIDYDRWSEITFNTDHALFKQARFPVCFFHLGRFFPAAVRIHQVERGWAREVIYNQADFNMPRDSVAHGLPKGAGFAGLRFQEPRDGALDWRRNDWAAFLGASYFRAIGELYQYGLSARGVAIDTAVYDKPEEFPVFTNLYVEEPGGDRDSVILHALLEGPSIVGAYRFVMTRGKGVVMEIDQTLLLRRPVTRLGLAPLTSMYWFSETAKPTAVDWRPEVHDSDGLSLWTGAGERIWRPLNDPPRASASAFNDHDPKGFGLMQRDRAFDHYLDGVYYDRRPSLWVEPKGGWGKGSVQLIELPTDDEINDNIVVAWVPDFPATAGSEFNLAYTLYWLAGEPHPSPLARCVATRLGRGGQPGQPRPSGARKFLVEFDGGPLVDLPFGVKPEMSLQASRGRIGDDRLIEAVPDGVAGHWRVQFDLAEVDGSEPVELRMHLSVGARTISETWMFQYHPF